AVKTITHRDLVSNGPAGLWQSGMINLNKAASVVATCLEFGRVRYRAYALTSSDHSGALVDVGRLDIDAGITVSASLQTEQGSQRSEERRVGKECRSGWASDGERHSG